MASSYITQGTNIVCTNMQVPKPLKIGVSPERAKVVNAISITKKQYYLTEADKKVNQCFQCKMAAKKWGGLAMLCAGIAVGAAILLTVATGGAAAILITAIAVAEVGVIGSSIALCVAYKTTHDCDLTLQAHWVAVHKTVRFKGKKALLNKSYMTCSMGGMLNLIVDDVAAQKAARIISTNNAKEITAQYVSKFTNGVLGGLTGGANIFSVCLAIGMEVYFEDSKSNQKETSFAEDAKEAIKQKGIEEGIEKGKDAVVFGKKAVEITQYNRGVTQQVYKLNEQALQQALAGNATRQASYELAADMTQRYSYRNVDISKGVFKKMGKDLLKGLGWAVVGFAIDEVSNKYEKDLEDNTMKKIKKINEEDNKTGSSVMAQQD